MIGVTASAVPFGMGAETTVTNSISTSTELGYERRTGIAAMHEETRTHVLKVRLCAPSPRLRGQFAGSEVDMLKPIDARVHSRTGSPFRRAVCSSWTRRAVSRKSMITASSSSP